MLVAQHLRDLNVDPSTHPRRQAHVSAASGLARVGGRLFIVADDEHHLGVFDEHGSAPVRLVRAFAGDLPPSKRARKASKPDLEALLALPAMPGYPTGALLALGSGSRPNRQIGLLAALDGHADISFPIRHLDLRPLYAPLAATFDHLNIEGAFIGSGALHLLQRASKSDPRNACISFDWGATVRWLTGSGPAPTARAIHCHGLGRIDGVPLGFTDGAALPDGAWVFSAVAEDSDDSYADGACKGAVLGFVDAHGALRSMQAIEGSPKVEGIAVQIDGDMLTLTLVTDGDDPARASQILSIRLALSDTLSQPGRSISHVPTPKSSARRPTGGSGHARHQRAPGTRPSLRPPLGGAP